MHSIATLLLLLISTPLAFAETQSVGSVMYGDLMVEDQPNELAGKNQLQLSGGYDVTNPYVNTYNLSLAYWRETSEIFDLGLEASGYSAERSRYNDRLNDELKVFGITANDDRAKYSAFATARLKLLQGRVNLLSMKALPFQFNLKVGTGYIWHEDDLRASCWTWGFEPVLFVTTEWGVALRFDQDLENFWHRGDTIYRNRLAIGINRAF